MIIDLDTVFKEISVVHEAAEHLHGSRIDMKKLRGRDLSAAKAEVTKELLHLAHLIDGARMAVMDVYWEVKA